VKKSNGKKKGIKVNFAGSTTFKKIPDGKYHAKVKSIDEDEGDQGPYWKWRFEIVEDGKLKGQSPMPYTTSFAPKALWNLRQLLESLGVEVPDDEVTLDKDEYVDLELIVRVENEVWEGKERPKVTDFEALTETAEVDDDEEDEKEEDEAEEAAEEEEAEEEEAEESEDDEEGKLSADEVKEMDEDELKSLVKKHKLKVDLAKFPKASKRIAAVIDALESADLLA